MMIKLMYKQIENVIHRYYIIPQPINHMLPQVKRNIRNDSNQTVKGQTGDILIDNKFKNVSNSSKIRKQIIAYTVKLAQYF